MRRIVDLVPGATQIAPAQVVRKDEHDVGPHSGRRGEERPRGEPEPGDDQAGQPPEEAKASRVHRRAVGATVRSSAASFFMASRCTGSAAQFTVSRGSVRWS